LDDLVDINHYIFY